MWARRNSLAYSHHWRSLSEHDVHVSHARHVPLRDVVIATVAPEKYAVHVNHARHVPLRDVAVKRYLTPKPGIHVSQGHG